MSCQSEKYCYREEKRKEKKRLREVKRELKRELKQQKRQEKQRHRQEKQRLRDEFVARLFNNLSLSGTTPRSNVHDNTYVSDNNINENEVATLRTIFPDCDPMYIRNCLANETAGDERVRKVAEKLLSTTYPKVAPVTPLTPPTAPPLNLTYNNSESPFGDEAPPSYEESVGSKSLQPPPLPNRHQRASSWNGNGLPSSSSSSPPQTKNSQFSQHSSRGVSTASTASTELTDAFGGAVKTLLDNFKPATVDHACQKYNYILSRPISTRFKYKPFEKQFKVLPKDKFSIQKGFNQSNYPSKELRKRDISERDWYFFMNGLNSIIGVNSIKGNSANLDQLEGVSVGLKWVSWMNIATMNDSLMEANIAALNEYVANWNSHFFNPRRIMVELIDNRIQSTEKYEQYLLVKSI